MSKLEELIQELCFDGVEYYPLKSITKSLKKETLRTSNVVKEKSIDYCYPVINSGRELYGFYSNFNNEYGITIAARGENAGFVNYFSERFWAGGLCYPYASYDETVVLSRFIFYFLKSKEKWIRETLVMEGSIPALNKSDLDKLLIPVPPLPVQEEIVKILDQMTDYVTELNAELKAELKARKMQYEYYRDQLINNNSVSMTRLGDFASIKRGGNFQKKDFKENGKPCIHYGQIYTYYDVWADKTLTSISNNAFEKSKQAVPGDIIMAVTSENVEDVCSCVAWIGQEPIAISGHTAIIHHNQNAKYLSYYFHTNHFFQQKKKLAHGTKVIEVTPDKLNGILVPLPNLDEQKRIVAILDRFDALCNDISSGLPAEIEARQKQYEYYRDKLLTFKELQHDTI